MLWWQAVLLGIVQGLGEFLPISSSGHLVLFQNILGITEEPMLFATLLHVGTLAAVFIVLWQDILPLLKHPFSRVVLLVIGATVPAVIAQLLFGDFFESTFSGGFLGWAFLITAFFLLATTYLDRRRRNRGTGRHALAEEGGYRLEELTWVQALTMGVVQAVAILPGVSRSGSTLCGGLVTGARRESAARFSFLMSIPVILGSVVLQAKDIVELGSGAMTELPLPVVLLGMAASLVSGLLALKWMIWIVKKGKLWAFGVYTLALGVLILVDQYLLHWVF